MGWPFRTEYEAISEDVEALARRSRRKTLLRLAGAVLLLGVLVTGTFTLARRSSSGATGALVDSFGNSCNGRALTLPPVRRSEAGELHTTLGIAVHRVHRSVEGSHSDGAVAGDACSPLAYNARLYEGMLPGPTLEVEPGDVVMLTLRNDLEGNVPGAPAAATEGYNLAHPVNTLRLPNSTNVHVHGMHVSPKGTGDNIYREVPPEEARLYVYRLPMSHRRGVNYYHPHLHGSSALQVLAGMSGAVVVRDRDGMLPLPGDLRHVRDFLCVLQRVNLNQGSFRSFFGSSKASDSLVDLDVRDGANNRLTASSDLSQEISNYILVNGNYRPTIRVAPDEVFRLRLLNSGSNDYMHFFNPADFPCDVAVMARDGYYQPETHLLDSVGITLAPGSRADVLVRCPQGGRRLVRGSLPPSDLLETYFGSGTDFYTGHVLELIVGDVDAGDVEAKPVIYRHSLDLIPVNDDAHPDLRSVPSDEVHRSIFRYSAGPKLQPLEEASGISYTWYGVNGRAFVNEEPSLRVPLGGVAEWVVVNDVQLQGHGPIPGASTTQPHGEPKAVTTNHPFHLHTNHFQIVGASFGDSSLEGKETGDWRIGDWRDTISVPTPGNVTIRFRADDFDGLSLAHCHIFAHSDTGMSMPFLIDPVKKSDDAGR